MIIQRSSVRHALAIAGALAAGFVFLPGASAGPADHGGHAAAAPQSAADASTTFKAGDITVTAPWTRATPGGAKVAGGYLKIVNNGTAADRLIKAESSIAGHIEIHEMTMTGGVMKMRPVTEDLVIKPGQSVELAPGGLHVMFMDLKRPLKQGETVKATLAFEKAGPLEVVFKVNALGATSTHKH
jgi:copper(I)-binding protein